jgi:hypothetical protein
LQLETLAHVGALLPNCRWTTARWRLYRWARRSIPPRRNRYPRNSSLRLATTSRAHRELQVCSPHWTKPLQFRLVLLAAAMHVPRADEQLLPRHVLHIVVSVMPVTTDTKASGLLHPRGRPLDPPLPPETAPTGPVPPASLLWFSLLERRCHSQPRCHRRSSQRTRPPDSTSPRSPWLTLPPWSSRPPQLDTSTKSDPSAVPWRTRSIQLALSTNFRLKFPPLTNRWPNPRLCLRSAADPGIRPLIQKVVA